VKCPHCDKDIPVPSALTRACNQIEGLELDAVKLEWCRNSAPGLDPHRELELFKIQFRRSEYRLSAGKGGLVRNGWAAFQYHMLQAVKFSAGRTSAPVRRVASKPERKLE